ncbi:hypothetical protein LguiA_023060 [Lonicera macranthoides]
MMSTLGRIRICCLNTPYTAETPLLRTLTALTSFRHRQRRPRLFSASFSSSAKKDKVIVISGPTGAGKSRLALELAKRLNGEIISADSVQVYRGLDIGSAKPSISEREIVLDKGGFPEASLTSPFVPYQGVGKAEVPHHLVDILHPSEDYSVGQFFEDARQTTREILNNGRVPIVTGGTGLYLRWFIYGKPDVPKASPEIASEVQSELADLQRDWDWDTAVQLVVKAGDPSAESLAANDWYRLRRRLEIIRSSGSPPSAFQVPYNSFRQPVDSRVTDCSLEINSSPDDIQESKPKDLEYDYYCFFLSSNRLELYRSIDFRCEDMLSGSAGILSEAKWLLDMGLEPNSNSATRAIVSKRAVGVPYFTFQVELLLYMDGVHLNFAKRQMTWFRNEQIYHWLDASKPLEEVLGFIYDAYLHKESGNLVVPESLSMQKEMSNHREIKEMKSYRTKNRIPGKRKSSN